MKYTTTIASSYNQRYDHPRPRLGALRRILGSYQNPSVLEVGCGTGYWLNCIADISGEVVGLDISPAMLAIARENNPSAMLIEASAEDIPCSSARFDVVFCVDVIHHIVNKAGFIRAANRVLKSGGTLAIIGHTPNEGTTDWFIYQYFEGVWETEKSRYIPVRDLFSQLTSAGFSALHIEDAEVIHIEKGGAEIFCDPYLVQNSFSQLALLSQEQYDAGIRAMVYAYIQNPAIVFKTHIEVKIITGRKP